MISSDLIRGSVDLLVLDSVWEAPSYGYAISKRIEERAAGRYSLKETTLYLAHSSRFVANRPRGGREPTTESPTSVGNTTGRSAPNGVPPTN